jgi:hypothetical protein
MSSWEMKLDNARWEADSDHFENKTSIYWKIT